MAIVWTVENAMSSVDRHMKKKEKIGFGTALATLIFLIGAGLLYTGSIRVYNSYASLRWPETGGLILSSGVVDYGSPHKKHNHMPDITYEYTLGSEKYVSSRVRFVPVIVSSEAAQEFANKYQRGKRVMVRYKPSNPGVSVLEPGAFTNTWVNAVIGAILVFLVTGICSLYWMARLSAGKPRESTAKDDRETVDKILKRPGAGQTGKEPPAGKGTLRSILWIILAFCVFWWLNSTGGETTTFRKIVSVLFGLKMQVVLTMLGAVGMILLCITVVSMAAQVMTVPRMTPLTDPSARALAPAPRDTAEGELQGLGFRFIGDFDADMSATASIRVRAYADPDRICGAVLMDGKTGNERVTILEFSTRLHPSGSIMTNNSPHPQISSYPLDKCVFRVPWKKTAEKVLELHQALCRAAREEKFVAEPFSVETFADDAIKATRKDMEYQVETGRYTKVGEDQYRQSLLGVVIAVPRLWLNMTYSFLFSWYRPPTGFLCRRLRRRLRKFTLQIKEKNEPGDSAGDDDETPGSPPISAKEREAVSVKM